MFIIPTGFSREESAFPITRWPDHPMTRSPMPDHPMARWPDDPISYRFFAFFAAGLLFFFTAAAFTGLAGFCTGFFGSG